MKCSGSQQVGISALFGVMVFSAQFALAPIAAGMLKDAVQVQCNVQATEASIELSSGELEWEGYWHEQRYRFNSSIVTCHFHAAGSDWTIRAYHTNGLDQTPLSCVYTDSVDGNVKTNWLPVKVWQPSYGPVNYYEIGQMPNPMDDDAYFMWPYVPCDLSRDGWNSSPMTFNFMVDAQYAVEGTYNGTIFLELMME